jgi:hypothetical protein
MHVDGGCQGPPDLTHPLMLGNDLSTSRVGARLGLPTPGRARYVLRALGRARARPAPSSVRHGGSDDAALGSRRGFGRAIKLLILLMKQANQDWPRKGRHRIIQLQYSGVTHDVGSPDRTLR